MQEYYSAVAQYMAEGGDGGPQQHYGGGGGGGRGMHDGRSGALLRELFCVEAALLQSSVTICLVVVV